MSLSANSILCYGFRLKNEEGEEEGVVLDWLRRERMEGDESNDNLMDFEDFVAQLYGLVRPPFDRDTYASDLASQAAHAEFQRQLKALREEAGVELVTHRHTDHRGYILAARASVRKVSEGGSLDLGQSVVAQEEWREKLRAFCERAALPALPFEDPQLILCSYYG